LQALSLIRAPKGIRDWRGERWLIGGRVLKHFHNTEGE
jgi:hypothetical protein